MDIMDSTAVQPVDGRGLLGEHDPVHVHRHGNDVLYVLIQIPCRGDLVSRLTPHIQRHDDCATTRQ